MNEAELVYRELGSDQINDIKVLDQVIDSLQVSNFQDFEYIKEIAAFAVESHIQYTTALDSLPLTVHGAITRYELESDDVLSTDEKKVIIRCAQRMLMRNQLHSN